MGRHSATHYKIHLVAIDRAGIAKEADGLLHGNYEHGDMVVRTNLSVSDINHRCSDYTGEDRKCPRPELFHNRKRVLEWAKGITKRK